jgi:hypothetical protein
LQRVAYERRELLRRRAGAEAEDPAGEVGIRRLDAIAVELEVGFGEGASAMAPGGSLHEWLHDGRHLLGFPATDVREDIVKMVRTLLICGLVAGVLAFAFESVVGEPAVDAAIA